MNSNRRTMRDEIVTSKVSEGLTRLKIFDQLENQVPVDLSSSSFKRLAQFGILTIEECSHTFCCGETVTYLVHLCSDQKEAL
ncbi:hypothetical protein STEG23_030767, partial [Scotinomys teguina]